MKINLHPTHKYFKSKSSLRSIMKAAFQGCEDTTFIKMKKPRRNDQEVEVLYGSDYNPRLSPTCTDIEKLPPLFSSFDIDNTHSLICLPVLHSQMEKNQKHAHLNDRGIMPLEPLVLLGNETQAHGNEVQDDITSVTIPPAYLINVQIAKCRSL